jgi:hypothetical protein
VAALRLPRSYEEEGFERQLARIGEHTDEVALSIWNGVLAGPGIFRLLTNPALLDVAEHFCGLEIIASSVYRLRPKIPRYAYGAVPWHQDSGYFEPFCDRFLVLTAWVPLVDATAERGCLWVLPRFHREGRLLRHAQAPGKQYLEIPEGELPKEPQAVCVPVRKGGVLLMSNLTPHASFENTSDVVRWSMDLRYQNAALPTNAPMTRLAGEAVPDPERGVPVACYPPEADFLARSRLRPDEVLKDPAEFERLRRTYQRAAVTNRWNAVWK